MSPTQLLSLAPKASTLILCIWLAGFTGTGFGQSLPMIITCQLPLENCRGDSEIQSQALPGCLGSWFGFCFCFCKSLPANPHAQQPPHTPGAERGFCSSSPRAQVLAPTFPLALGQVSGTELRVESHHSR